MGILADLGVDDEEMAELAKKLLANKKWLHENYERVSKIYANKFVAVENNRIIENADDMDSLIKKLKNKNRNINKLFIELVNPNNALFATLN